MKNTYEIAAIRELEDAKQLAACANKTTLVFLITVFQNNVKENINPMKFNACLENGMISKKLMSAVRFARLA